MKIEEKNEDGVIILSISGKMLAGAGVDRLLRIVDKHVAAGHTEIVLDLADLIYIDSAGLGEIIRCRTVVSSKNATLKLRNIPRRVYDRLSITRLVSLFEDEDDVGGAAD